MSQNINDRIAGKLRGIAEMLSPDNTLVISSEVERKIMRADGTVETSLFKNTPIYKGLNRLAFRATTYTNTVAQYLVVGTQTAAHSLGSVQAGLGEVLRKQATSVVQSQDWFALSCSLGGASDGLTGIALASIGMTDYVNSHATNDTFFGMSNSLGLTLAASDTALITYRIRVGSHNLGQST
jgi:hypothetical protein